MANTSKNENWSFHESQMIADRGRKLGHVRKKYVQDFPNLSPTILNSQGTFYYQFDISFVVKIWDSMETANLQMDWNFSDKSKLKDGANTNESLYMVQ